MTHPSGVGAIRIGNWLYQALMDRYADYLKRRAEIHPGEQAPSEPAQSEPAR